MEKCFKNKEAAGRIGASLLKFMNKVSNRPQYSYVMLHFKVHVSKGSTAACDVTCSNLTK